MKKITPKVKYEKKNLENNFRFEPNIHKKYHLKEDYSFINNQKMSPFNQINRSDLNNLAPHALKNENHTNKETDLTNRNPQSKDNSFPFKGKIPYPTYHNQQKNKILNPDIYNIIINKNKKEEEKKKIYYNTPNERNLNRHNLEEIININKNKKDKEIVSSKNKKKQDRSMKLEDFQEESESLTEKYSKSLYSHHTEHALNIENYNNPNIHKKSSEKYEINENKEEKENSYSFLKKLSESLNNYLLNMGKESQTSREEEDKKSSGKKVNENNQNIEEIIERVDLKNKKYIDDLVERINDNNNKNIDKMFSLFKNENIHTLYRLLKGMGYKVNIQDFQNDDLFLISEKK